MKVSICIASYNQRHLLKEALASCLLQDYGDFEIVVLDDASTDGTCDLPIITHNSRVKYFRSDEPSGTGGAFNKAISHATGDYIILLCSDDLFTNPCVISDIVRIFENNPKVAHVTRYYHQFIDCDRSPVRAWRCNNVMELANNPSGLAFRRSAIGNAQLSNKMFVEASTLVSQVMADKRNYAMIMPWDTVAVRIHNSTARSKDYYRKRWTSSPVEEWTKVGGKTLQQDFTSLIQIANYFERSAVLKECKNFIRLNPLNLFNIGFWFFAIISVCTPSWLLMRLPHWYRITIGRWTTREVKRP